MRGRTTLARRPRLRGPTTRLAAALGERPRLAAGLFVVGGAAVALALVASVLGLAASSAFGWKKATLLIVGCDLIVAALIVSARRVSPTDDADVDLASLLNGAIADGVILFAISAAAVIVLFGQAKPIERLGYFLAILVIVPLSVTLAWRRQQAGAAGERQQLLAFATLAATASVLCLARLLALPATGTLDASLFVLLALVGARVAIALSGRFVPAAWPHRFPAQAAVATTPLLLAAAAIPFVPAATLSVVDVAVALAAGLATFDLVRAFGGRRGPSRAWTRAIDAGVLVVSTLVVVYVGLPNLGLALNHNYFLGPATDVLHGHPMLVGTFSQYGVGLIDALAAVFLIVPIGYGTFTLLLSGLTVLLFAVIYVVLRWSTESLLISAAGLTVAVVLYVFGQLAFYTYFPSTGVLRFGLPWLVILLSLASARTERHKQLLDALVLATVAVAAVWSGEAGVYCLGTAVALACLDTAVANASARERIGTAARRIARLLAASLLGLLAFTLLTRAATGAWADWGGYLEYIRLYTTSGFGVLPIEPWSPGLALGAMYTVSAIAIVLLVLTRPALVRERAVAFRAATGLTVLGALVYTYFLGRAAENNLIHISPPAIALLFVWLGIVRSTFDSRIAVAVASGTAIFLGAMIVASESEDISQKYPSTALAAVLGSAPPLGNELRALWHNPVVNPTAAHVVGFVSSLGPRRGGLTFLLTPSVETEALLRLHTANAVGSSNPCQESLSKQGSRRVAAAARSLRPGGIVVTSVNPQDAGQLLPIEQYALALLRGRFTLQEISSDGQGLQAFRMIPPVPVASRAAAPRRMSTHPTTVPSTNQAQPPPNAAPICA
jgi:hypothetical protein